MKKAINLLIVAGLLNAASSSIVAADSADLCVRDAKNIRLSLIDRIQTNADLRKLKEIDERIQSLAKRCAKFGDAKMHATVDELIGDVRVAVEKAQADQEKIDERNRLEREQWRKDNEARERRREAEDREHAQIAEKERRKKAEEQERQRREREKNLPPPSQRFSDFKAGMNNTSLEKELLAAIRRHGKMGGWQEGFVAAKIYDHRWEIVRHPASGRILRREISAFVLAKWPGGKCTVQLFGFGQEHHEQGYSESLYVTGVGDQSRVVCP